MHHSQDENKTARHVENPFKSVKQTEHRTFAVASTVLVDLVVVVPWSGRMNWLWQIHFNSNLKCTRAFVFPLGRWNYTENCMCALSETWTMFTQQMSPCTIIFLNKGKLDWLYYMCSQSWNWKSCTNFANCSVFPTLLISFCGFPLSHFISSSFSHLFSPSCRNAVS